MHHGFKFVDEKPQQLKKLRLKVKKTIQPDDSYKVPYGELGRKYWCSEKDIYNLLSPDMGNPHQNRLTALDRKKFNAQAYKALDHFNYDY